MYLNALPEESRYVLLCMFALPVSKASFNFKNKICSLVIRTAQCLKFISRSMENIKQKSDKEHWRKQFNSNFSSVVVRNERATSYLCTMFKQFFFNRKMVTYWSALSEASQQRSDHQSCQDHQNASGSSAIWWHSGSHYWHISNVNYLQHNIISLRRASCRPRVSHHWTAGGLWVIGRVWRYDALRLGWICAPLSPAIRQRDGLFFSTPFPLVTTA